VGNTPTRAAGQGTTRSSQANVPPKHPKPEFWDYIFKTGYEAEMAAYQNEFNYWMWNQENKYNTPQSQMDRYRDAGLNENLIYGQGGPGNARQGAAAERGGVSGLGMNPLSIINQIQDVRMKSAQAKQVETNTRYTEEQIKSEPINRFLAKVKGSLSNAQFIELENQLKTQWGYTRGERYNIEGTPGWKSIIAGSQKDVTEAELEILKKKMQEKTLDWLKANNLSRWIPAMGLLFKFL